MPQQWFLYPFDNPAGQSEPFGGGPKPDSNVQCPDGTPITALLPGTISGINAPDGSIPAWGAVVTVKLDTPYNPIATHTAYLHLAPVPSNLRRGQHVNAGDLIGYSGGTLAQGAQKVPLGFALYNGDYYGYGSSWSKYVGTPELNPYPLLQSAAGGSLNIPAKSGLASFLTGGSGIGGTSISLAPTANVTTTLYVLDQVLQITNPFTEGMDTVKTDSIAGLSFTDPVAAVEQFGTNLVNDASAIIVRTMMLLLGFFILAKVFSTFVNVGAATGAVMSGAKTVAGLAAL